MGQKPNTNFLSAVSAKSAVQFFFPSSYCSLCFLVLFLSIISGLLATPIYADELTHEQKLEAAQRVYDQLVQAIGDSRPAPRLRLRSSVQVACYWPDKHEIDLDERAFDLCQSMPDRDAALSVLLGHELAHYYGHHGWTQEFGNAIPDDLAGQLKILSDSDRLQCEMQADYFGGYYGYLAGFNTLGEFPKLIEAIYHRYDRMPGYPSLSEREAIADQAQEKLARLIPVFDAGNVLLALREYESAAFCFDTIAADFPSREILNNAGVARAQAALELLRADAELTKFVYPFELDADTRLRLQEVSARGLDDETRLKAYGLLVDAERCFDEAKTKDPQYAPAYVNLAGVYDLLGEEELAAAFADKAAKVSADWSDTISGENAKIMLAIINARQNKNDAAIQILNGVESAGGAAAELAKMNLDVLHGGAIPTVSAAATTQPAATESTAESIADATGNVVGDAKGMDDPPYDTITLSTFSADQPDVTIRSKSTDSWQGYRIDIGDRVIAAYSTRSGYAGKTARGIAIGDELDKVISAYGPAADVTAERQGYLYRFDSSNLIFRIGPGGKVAGWIIYSRQ
jgi:tetratricopeptide (TPR) repeat protein